MRKPHIKSLCYKLVPKETLTYDSPPPVEDETDHFSMSLDNDIVTFKLKEHFSSEKEARKTVEEYLEAWEIDIGLSYGSNEVRFEYLYAEIIDLDPPPPGEVQIAGVSATATAAAIAEIIVHTTRAKYPSPPKDFKVTPDIRSMWDRYNQYRIGRETIAAASYFCLTVLEYRFERKKRQQAAKAYNISCEVLDKVGYLSSNIGDASTARKRGVDEFRPHTPSEVIWLETAIKTFIRRIGEIECISIEHLEEITMYDLPKL